MSDLKAISFTAHALGEMEARRISKSIAIEVLESPDQKVPTYGGRTCFQSKVRISGKVYLIRVVVDERVDPNLVITVYRTSRISRYWSKS